MIICEERAVERILSLGFCDTAIPISIRKEFTEEVEITVLPSLKKTAQKFEKLFSGRYFSSEAHAWLRENVRPFMDSIGYHDNRQSRKVSLVMSRAKNSQNPGESNAVILDSPVKNLTSADIPSLLEFGHIVSAVIIDGAIVSCAYTDLNPDGAKSVEIGIETATLYRRKGYAKSALVGLIRELEKKGIAPVYICSESNRPSIKLARSCNFIPEAREYNYVFRRN